VSQYVEQAREEFEKARQRMVEEAEKGLADFRRFVAEFQRRYEALRRYFTEDLSKLDEKERRQLEEVTKSVVERLGEAVRHFAVIDKAPRARVVAALNEALQRLAEGKAPLIPRDASVEGVVKHLALMDLETAVKVLRSAEKYLEAHYAVAPTRYDTRQIAAEVARWKIEEQLPTLKLARAARGIVLGARSAEEGEALLRAWEPRDVHGLRLALVAGRTTVVDVYEGRPWEAVAYRFSYIHERPLDVREAVRIKSDVVLTVEYAKYLAGFRAEEKAREVLRKAVEYSRIMHMLERAEELKLTPLAVERLTADAERLKQEVLHETTEIFRRFREEFFFVRDLLEGHRVVRREVTEVREVVKAFEDALAEALKAPERRERAFREVFAERVERLVEEHARRGDVEAVERIRRAAAEMAEISEAVGWRAVEDVALVLPAVAKAFEEALRAVGQSRDASRFAEVFKAKAEEAARQLEQQGMGDVASRVRRAADKIAGEIYAGGWGAVERLRPLLSPEHAGGVLGRLEFLHTLFSTEALNVYRELRHLQNVEELAREVKSLASTVAEVLTAEAAEGLRRAAALGREAEAVGRKISELSTRAEALNADVVKPALEAAVSRDYSRAFSLIDAAERAVKERLAAAGDVEPLAKTLERLGLEPRRLDSPEYRQRAVREVEEAAAALRGLADLPAAVQRAELEKAAKAAEAFGLAETASLFRAVERVRAEAGDVYAAFAKALAEALKAPEGERAELFRRVFSAEVEAVVKDFESRGLKKEAEALAKTAEAALKLSEAIGWRAPEEVKQRLSSAVEEAERLIAKLRDEAAVRQIYEYASHAALVSLVREVKEAVAAKREAEERLVKLIDEVRLAVERTAPHLSLLLERLKAGDYSVLPRLEEGLAGLAERQRRLGEAAETPVNTAEVLRKAAEAVLAVKDEVEKARAALRAGRWAEAAEAVGRVEDAARRWKSRNEEAVGKVEEVVALSREAGAVGRKISELMSRAGALEGEAARLLSAALEALQRGEYGVAAKQLEAVEKAFGESHILKLVREARVEAEGLARTAEKLAEVLEKAPSPELEKALEAVRRGEVERAREILTRIEAAGAVEEVVKAVKEAKSLLPAAQPEERVYALALAAAGVSGLEAAAVKTALEAAAGRSYSRASALIEAVEKAANERLATMRDVEPVAKTLERLGLEPRRLTSLEYREQAVKEVEKAVESLRSLANLPTAVQRDVEKAARAAEAFGLAETAALFKVMEKVRKEAGDVYPVFIKALTEALRASPEERAETFRRVFASETEKMIKAFEERGLKADAENLRRAAETAVKASESIAWKAPEEAAQRLTSAVEEAERLMARLRDEAVVRQISEYGYYSALASLAREAREAVTAKRDVEEKLAKLIDDVKPAVERVAPHLSPLLERVKAGDYSVLPALEAELPKLAERHRQLQRLVDELGEARKSLEKVVHIDKKVKELEKALKKAPEDVRAVFDEALKALERRDFERAVAELDKILKIIEEKRARFEPLEKEVRGARALAEQLRLEKAVKALERPTEKNVAKALGELERELARIYGALELVEYVKRPRADAEFGHAWAAARMLGLEEADRLFRALSEVSLYQLREGREIFRNPLYDEVKYLVDQEWVRSLVKAPMYSYVVDRLGPDILQPTYARWYGFFVEYGPYLATAYEHARTSAVKAGAPLGLTGGFSYASKMMKWLGDFSQEAVMRGLKAYYKGEGRGFRELSEMTIRGAKIQLFDKAASLMMAKAAQMLSEAKTASDEAVARRLEAEAYELKLLASVLRAKAAYEEVRLVQTYLKGAERRAEALIREAEALLKEGTPGSVEASLELERRAKEMHEAAQRKAERYLADARARHKAYFTEVRDFVGGHGDIREVGIKYFGLTARAFAGDPEVVAERMIRAVDVRRVISWVDELKLPRELGEIAVRIADAERVYNKFEKILRAKTEPIPPVYDLEKAGRFFAEAKPHPPPPKPRVEDAVPKVVRDVLTAYYGRLKDAAEKAALYLALVKNDTRHASREVRRAYQALQKALKAKDKEEALKALEELKKALKALGVEAEGEDAKTVLKAVEERLRPAYEEYANTRREYISAVEAIAKFSPEAALALGEAAREGGADSIGRWMSLVAYETGRRALEEYARFWARPVEERWDALPPAVRELIAKREEEAVYELVRNTLRNVGIGLKKGVELDLQGYEKALERVFTANGEWPEMREYVKQVIEAARRVQRGEASTEELEKAVDSLLAAYGARAAERFVRSDRLEDAVAEMHEGMRHFARDTGLRIGREAAERALLFGLSVMPEDVVGWYARDGWRGRLEPYVAYWTEDEGLARRAGEAGWEVRQIKRPVSFEEGVPKEWRTAYVVAPFGFDLSAVERAVVGYVDGAREGVARVRAVEWPVPEVFLWFILRDREPVREGEWIVAYSIDRLSIEEPLSKFGEALKARNFDEARRAVRELYEARFNRTLWQIVYEFDRERAEAALEHLRGRYGEPESRVWERYDELYLTWLAFRLADEFEAYLRSGAGRRLEKEAFGDLLALGRWLPVELAPLFWLRLVGDAEGEAEFRAAWITAVNMWFERMAAPYTPKKPAVARKTIELFNAFTGAGFKYEELFPPPPPKPEAAKPVETQKPEVVKPETVAKPEAAEPEIKPAEAKPAVEVQRLAVGERGLRREGVERSAAGPGAVKSEVVKPEAARTEAAGPEGMEVGHQPAEVRGLRRGPRAPVADVIPERFGAVEHLVQRFGVVLDKEAAFKAEGFVKAKIKARLEKVAVKEPEFAHILAEVAGDVLSSFGRLMASPDAARHVHEALFYFFEGYETRDGEVLFKMIEHTVREAVRRAGEAGIPDAEYRVKQFVLEVIDVLARAGERYRRDALKGVLTVEKALRATAFAGLSAAALYSVYHGLYSEAVVSSVASAVALVDVGRFREAVEYVQKAAKALYEAAKEAFEKAKVTVQRLVELFVEAVARVLAWVDEHKAYLFLMAAVTAGVVALGVALNLWGLVEMEKLAHAAVGAPFVAGLVDAGGRAAERFRAVADRWRVDENVKQKIEEILNASQKGERPYETLRKLSESGNLPPPLAKLKEALEYQDEVVQDAAVVAALVLYKTLVKNAKAYGEWAEVYRWARRLVEKQGFAVAAGDIKRLREAQKWLEEVAEEVRRELNRVLVLYSQSDFYKERPDLLNKLKQHLEVDLGEAEELAEARSVELSKYSDINMGTKAYAALLSVARGGIYGHAAMLLMGEGALADVVLLTPGSAYKKAWEIAKGRGETVDPSRSPKGVVDWEDRAASVLLRFLIGYGEADLKFRLVEREVKKDGEKRRVERGFQVFRVYGGVEAPVGELWIGKVARFNISKEELRCRVEEAKRTAPDLSGLDKAPQYLEWRATDVSTVGRQIVAGTVHPWQLRWYFSLLGEEKSYRGRADVTKEGIKPAITVYWPREREDQILRESRWLESLLGRPVKSWRELVDAINWSWVLKRVEELAGELKPWIGPEKMSDAERKRLVRRMLGELALLAHFAEARRSMDDSRWREERAKKLAMAVEALSGGRIGGEYAERLAKLIILYAESRAESVKERIDNLAGELAGVSKEEVWGVVDFVLSDMYCLARDCADDKIIRKFVAPALELIMLEKALRGEFGREEALRIFGEMYATAVAGDGHVRWGMVDLAVGGELGGGAALLRLATLQLLSQLLPDELKFNMRVYIDKGAYHIASAGENAARFKRLLAVSAPSAGGEYLSPKFEGLVEEARVEVRLDKDSIRQTESGYVAADLTISEGGAAVKYNVYLHNVIELQFRSTDRGRVELAARLLKLAGVSAEVKKEGGGDVWRIEVTTDKLAAGREELRKALAEFVEMARKSVGEEKAKRWLEKLESGRVLKEGWPKYDVQLIEGAFKVRFESTNPDSIAREKQRLENMGLEEGRHFTMKMPEEGREGYVYILRRGLERAAWLSVHSKDKDQREPAADFVKLILKRAEEAGKEVYEKAKEIIEEGKARGSQKLEGFEKKFEVNGKTYVVKVIGGEAVEEKQNGRKLLRIKITAEVGRVEGDHIVDRVVREYTITYSRRRADNAAEGYAYASAKAPGGREADAERYSALIKALTGKEPRVYRMKNGNIMIECGSEHLEGFARFAELAEAIVRWLEETGR
jgi:hypothetical protein